VTQKTAVKGPAKKSGLQTRGQAITTLSVNSSPIQGFFVLVAKFRYLSKKKLGNFWKKNF
jgi:hypothetical protein